MTMEQGKVRRNPRSFQVKFSLNPGTAYLNAMLVHRRLLVTTKGEKAQKLRADAVVLIGLFRANCADFCTVAKPASCEQIFLCRA